MVLSASLYQILPFNAEDLEALQAFLKTTKTTREAIEKIGTIAQGIGCVARPNERIWHIRTGFPVLVLHRPRQGWNSIDGTVVQDKRDTQLRHRLGVKWNNNSCAVDVVLTAGIQLDAGRLQIDQICPDAQAELTVPAALLRRIVSKL
jgi:hypothetical protein